MRFSKTQITLGVSAGLILGLPTYLYADQHFGPAAGEPMGILVRHSKNRPFTATAVNEGAMRQEGDTYHFPGHLSLRHDNGTQYEMDYEAHFNHWAKGSHDLSLDCKENGIMATHTLDSENGELRMAEGGSSVTMQLQADGRVKFENREYKETDRALVDAVKKTGHLSHLNRQHFACAAELSERWGNKAAKGGGGGGTATKVVQGVGKVAQAIPQVMSTATNVFDMFSSMF